MKKLFVTLLIGYNFLMMAQVATEKPDFKNDEYSKKFVERTDFKFGMELVRLDKNNKEILIRKLEYPLKVVRQEWNEKWQTNICTYAGRITFPLDIYNPQKKELAINSSKVRSAKINYTLSVSPFQKKEDTYTCQLIYMTEIMNISFKKVNGVKYPNETAGNHSMNPIKIKVGEKVKINLEDALSTLWGIEDTVAGTSVTFEAEEDYNKYFNDYLIISLESEGETSKNLNAENIKKMQENTYRASKRSANRDNVVATLTAIIADAQNYYWNTKRKKSFVGWKLPDVYKNMEVGQFSVEITKESVKVTGIGKETGNDGVNPVKVIMVAVPEKISSTSVLN